MMLLLPLLLPLSLASASGDYSVSDIDCSHPGPRLSASLTKPRGYGGVPVFADRLVRTSFPSIWVRGLYLTH